MVAIANSPPKRAFLTWIFKETNKKILQNLAYHKIQLIELLLLAAFKQKI